jgi:hypothetical protein
LGGKKIFRTEPPRRDTTVRLLPLHRLIFNGRKRAASASVSALRDLGEKIRFWRLLRFFAANRASSAIRKPEG